MATSVLGRVVGDKIELDEPIAALDGKRVFVIIDEVDAGTEGQLQHTRAEIEERLARPVTDEERAKVERSRESEVRYTTAELRERLAAARRGAPKRP